MREVKLRIDHPALNLSTLDHIVYEAPPGTSQYRLLCLILNKVSYYISVSNECS